jgi:hypothetical protein
LDLPESKACCLFDHPHWLTLEGPEDIFPASSDADPRLADYEPSLTDYNEWISGERVVTSFSLQISKIEETDTANEGLTKGLGVKHRTVTVRVEPVARYGQTTVAWVTKTAAVSKAVQPLSRFGSIDPLKRSINEISYKGGMSFVKQIHGEWIRYRE